ncbi:hypothetical protein V8C34DRAFT_317665 [Trichoderma compactum]
MIMHLHMGRCRSGSYYQRVEAYAKWSGSRAGLSIYIEQDKMYMCPTCGYKHPALSPLFRHVESRVCAESSSTSSNSVNSFLTDLKAHMSRQA